MYDPALYDLLRKEAIHLQPSFSKLPNEGETSFNQAYEKSINEYVDAVLEKQDPAAFKFISPAIRREKIENEVRETLNSPEIEKYVAKAVNIFDSEGLNYLSQEENNILHEELDQLRLRLKTLEFDQLNDETLKSAFLISDLGQELILKIGISKFEEGLLTDSLAILSFLFVLNSENAEYAYRLGIIAQKAGRDDEAIRAYDKASNLDPSMIGPYLFAAQCHFNCNEPKKAFIEVEKAKSILNSSEENKEWLSLVADMESLL